MPRPASEVTGPVTDPSASGRAVVEEPLVEVSEEFLDEVSKHDVTQPPRRYPAPPPSRASKPPPAAARKPSEPVQPAVDPDKTTIKPVPEKPRR